MEIRKVTGEEALEVHALRLRGLQESPQAFGATYEEDAALSEEVVRNRFSSSDYEFCLGAFDADGAIVGMVSFVRPRRVKWRHSGAIYGMYVAPEVRGRGVGKALMIRLIEEAKTIPGLERLALDVVPSQVAARALYRSLGFVTWGCDPDALKDDDRYYDVEHLALKLR